VFDRHGDDHLHFGVALDAHFCAMARRAGNVRVDLFHRLVRMAVYTLRLAACLLLLDLGFPVAGAAIGTDMAATGRQGISLQGRANSVSPPFNHERFDI